MIRKLLTFFLIFIFGTLTSLLFAVNAKAEVSPIRGHHSMPSIGTVKALVIRVGFEDYPLYEKDTESSEEASDTTSATDDQTQGTAKENDTETAETDTPDTQDSDTGNAESTQGTEAESDTESSEEADTTTASGDAANAGDSDTSGESGDPAGMKDSKYILSRADIEDYFMGTKPSSAEEYPYESLSDYYRRSSYGKLKIELGDIIDYTCDNKRDYYEAGEPGAGEIKLIKELLAYLDGKVDLSDYDSDKDGVADAVYIFYGDKPGPSLDMTFKPHCRNATSDGLSLNGTKLTHYAMVGLDEKSILMHETGHLLGLPDYYSKADGFALFGTSDMMYDNSGDHNGFSKWILGWLTDENVLFLDKNDAGKHITLTPIDSLECDGKKLAILSNPKSKNPYGRYLLVEYVSAENDMAELVGGTFPEGFRVFRVDAGLKDGFFIRNNDYYDTALLQVINHDYTLIYDSIYREGMELTPFTDPSSSYSDGTYTGFFLIDFNTGTKRTFKLDYMEKPVESTARETGKRINSADTGDENDMNWYLLLAPVVILCVLMYLRKKEGKI